MKIFISFVAILLTQLILGITTKNHIDYYKDTTGIFKLQLKSDNTYIYEYKLGFKYHNSKGRWIRKNNILILNSLFDDLLKIPLTVKEEINPHNNSLVFEITNPLPIDTICNYYIVIKDTIINIGNNGKLSLNKDVNNVPSIQVKYLCKDIVQTPYPLRNELISNIYQVKSNETNYFRIKWDINSDLFYYETIKNDTLVIKDKEISWPSKNLTLYKSKD